jgi:transposase
VDKTTGLRSDQVGYLALPKARENFPSPLRRIRFFDAEQKRFLVFLTNHMELPALTVAKLYKKRWEIELFFKWIKGNLRIKHYYGTSLNAVKTQIWIAVTTYLLVAILHKELKLPGSLHRTLQILSVHPFEKISLHELLMKHEFRNPDTSAPNQMELFDL